MQYTGAAVWSKRYCTLSETKMIYYLEQDRVTAKGEIVLSGATARASSTRSGSRKQHYFEIVHPECKSNHSLSYYTSYHNLRNVTGAKREFFAKSKNRMNQWIDKINTISEGLSKTSCFGKLFKQGGMNKNIWQERWCYCAGRQLDYFENASDNQVKGTIGKFASFKHVVLLALSLHGIIICDFRSIEFENSFIRYQRSEILFRDFVGVSGKERK